MSFDFSKMHGLGNDYVFVDAVHQTLPADLPELARRVSDRHFGIGSDGLIWVGPSAKAPVRMRIFNADGSEAQMCGNGLRCAARFAFERRLFEGKTVEPYDAMRKVLAQLAPQHRGRLAAVTVETGRGVLTVALLISSAGAVERACINLDRPILEPVKIPVDLPGTDAVARDLAVLGRTLKMTCVSMGNPHAVIFCDDVNKIDLDVLGPAIENHKLFPQRVNVHFVQVLDSATMRMITWERGSGRTMACGTGAAAVAVAGVLERRAARAVTIHLPGGSLSLLWNDADECVYQLGPAVEAFRGVFPS